MCRQENKADWSRCIVPMIRRVMSVHMVGHILREIAIGMDMVDRIVVVIVRSMPGHMHIQLMDRIV